MTVTLMIGSVLMGEVGVCVVSLSLCVCVYNITERSMPLNLPQEITVTVKAK